MVIEHPVGAGYKLRGNAEPVETTASWLRFRIVVGPKQTASLEVEEARPLVNTYQLTDLDREQVESSCASRPSITPSSNHCGASCCKRRPSAIRTLRRVPSKQIYEDQQRLRENIKSLKGSAEEKMLLQRYTLQMNEQENRLDRLRKQVEELNSKHQAAEAALDKMIQDLSFDVTV